MEVGAQRPAASTLSCRYYWAGCGQHLAHVVFEGHFSTAVGTRQVYLDITGEGKV